MHWICFHFYCFKTFAFNYFTPFTHCQRSCINPYNLSEFPLNGSFSLWVNIIGCQSKLMNGI